MVCSVGDDLNSAVWQRHPVLSSHHSVLVLDFFLGKVSPGVGVLQQRVSVSGLAGTRSDLSPELRTRRRKVWGESLPGRILERGGEELGEDRGGGRGPDLWGQTEGQPGRDRDQRGVAKPGEQRRVCESVFGSVLTGNYIFN